MSVLTNLEGRIAPEAVERAVTQIAKAHRIDCYGVGNTSMLIASDAQARFFRLGLNSNAYFDAHFQFISAATLTRSDIVLVVSSAKTRS